MPVVRKLALHVLEEPLHQRDHARVAGRLLILREHLEDDPERPPVVERLRAEVAALVLAVESPIHPLLRDADQLLVVQEDTRAERGRRGNTARAPSSRPCRRATRCSARATPRTPAACPVCPFACIASCLFSHPFGLTLPSGRKLNAVSCSGWRFDVCILKASDSGREGEAPSEPDAPVAPLRSAAEASGSDGASPSRLLPHSHTPTLPYSPPRKDIRSIE